MNIISKILTVLIFSGLFFVNKQHLEQKQLTIITIFIGLIILLTIVSNYKHTIKEGLNPIISQGKYELQVVDANKLEQDLYLNVIRNVTNKNNSCSNNENCVDVTVINKKYQDQHKGMWKLVDIGQDSIGGYTKYDIVFEDKLPNTQPTYKYLTWTNNNPDCQGSIGVDNTKCKDVIIDSDKGGVWWEIRQFENTNFYQIIGHHHVLKDEYYLYTIIDGEDGNSCQNAGLKSDFGCRNVFLMQYEHTDKKKYSQSDIPCYWKLLGDEDIIRDNLEHGEDDSGPKLILLKYETQAQMGHGQSLGYQCQQIGDRYICSNDSRLQFKFEQLIDLNKVQSIKLGDKYLTIPIDSYFKLKSATKKNVNKFTDDGYSVVLYDTETYICIKKLSEPNDETSELVPAAGFINFATEKYAKCVLSTINSKMSASNIDPSNNVLESDFNSVAESGYEKIPKLFVWFKDDIQINKFVIKVKQTILEDKAESAPYRIKIYDADKGLTKNIQFNPANSPTNDNTFIFAGLDADCRYMIIERDSTGVYSGSRGGVKLAITNIYAFGKSLKTISPDSEVQQTIKNERQICNIMTKRLNDKAYTELQDQIRTTELETVAKTQQQILSSINTPNTIIIWDNVEVVGLQIKLELLRKEYLHISGIQVYGTSVNSYDKTEKNWIDDPTTSIVLSSVYEDINGNKYDSDNCRDNNLDTYCRTNNTINPFPSILITFDELIKIDKIIVFNRKDKNQN